MTWLQDLTFKWSEGLKSNILENQGAILVIYMNLTYSFKGLSNFLMSKLACILHFSVAISSFLPLFHSVTASDPGAGLLMWKDSLEIKGPLNDSWTSSPSSPRSSCCGWIGISCDLRGDIKHIHLSGMGLVGTLVDFPFLQLPSLVSLNLSLNSLGGNLPHHLANLTTLTTLDFSRNNFFGQVPSSVGSMSKLLFLDLSRNYLSGVIPPEISTLGNLETLYLHSNIIGGFIPESLGNLSSLSDLDLTNNNLTGSIPETVGNLKHLRDFDLAVNRLSGPIPTSLGNLSRLFCFFPAVNYLSGSIPSELGKLHYLLFLELSYNNLSGPVPQLTNLTYLRRLHLHDNRLSGDISEFSCLNPQVETIDMSNNQLYGELSSRWGQCQKLASLKMSRNRLSGNIPTGLVELAQLRQLHLSSNNFEGEIPKQLMMMPYLFDLDLSYNNLSGNIPIPHDIGMISELSFLRLEQNKLTGSIPKLIGKCWKLVNLTLGNNRLTGSIPPQISNLTSLTVFSADHNLLTGEIPLEFGKLVSLEVLNLSYNGLYGSIPSNFEMMTSLVSIDLSNNLLEGEVPDFPPYLNISLDAFANNKDLCGTFPGINSCTTSTAPAKNERFLLLIIFPVCGAIILVLAAVVMLIIYNRLGKSRIHSLEHEVEVTHANVLSTLNFDGKKLYESIIQATKGFNSVYCIGTGGTSSVYKAEISTGETVAVKKLNAVYDSNDVDLKTFAREVHALTQIRHKNIVKLLGFCMHSQHSFLVYEYIARGSLRNLLATDEEAARLDWQKRVDVIKGMADGLCYLHHGCSPPIIHRDISSNNVLLGPSYQCYISDFGMARLLSSTDISSWSAETYGGTYGYMAPGESKSFTHQTRNLRSHY